MAQLEINVPIYTDDIIDALVNSFHAEEFVITLDEVMGDEGFTLNIIKKLAGVLARDYEEGLMRVTGSVLESQFVGGSNRWGAEDIKNYENALNAMREIIRLTESLEAK